MTEPERDATAPTVAPVSTGDYERNTQIQSWRVWFEVALIVIGLVALLVCIGHHVYSDGEVRYNELSALLLHGTLSYSKYSLIGPLFSAPIWFVGGWLHLPHRGVGIYNWCVFTLGIGTFYLLLKDRIDRRLLHAFMLLLIVGSMFPFHLTNYYGEVFTALCVAVGLVTVQVGRPVLGWFAVVLGVANTPPTIVALGLVALVSLHQTKRLQSLLPVVAAGALIATENWIRRGSPLATNYESGFGLPFVGLISIFFAFGKGLVFFTPGLFMPVRRALSGVTAPARRLLASSYALWMAYVVGLVVVYSPWWAWDGAWFWGPRFFLLASIPASLALALRLQERGISLWRDVMTLAALTLSVWVGVNGAIFGNAALLNLCTGNNYALYEQCIYLPKYSVLWYPFVAPQPLHWAATAFLLYSILVYVYLAAPLVRRISVTAIAIERQLIRDVRSQGKRMFNQTRP